MSERKAVNKWYPIDWDPSMGSVNKVLKQHPLRHRAKKLDQGLLTIRFEMPYNIWCNGCNNHIGMGVRYNSEKRKVGNYHSTIIYQFRMKCHLCDNYLEIRTDPKNHDYEIVCGARRQEKRWDAGANEQVVAVERQTHFKLNSDPMFKLQHQADDKIKLNKIVPELGDLKKTQSRYKEDWLLNRAARTALREEKREAKAQQALLGEDSEVRLVPETATDRKMANLLRFMNSETSEDNDSRRRKEIDTETIFCSDTSAEVKVISKLDDTPLQRLAAKLVASPFVVPGSRTPSNRRFSSSNLTAIPAVITSRKRVHSAELPRGGNVVSSKAVSPGSASCTAPKRPTTSVQALDIAATLPNSSMALNSGEVSYCVENLYQNDPIPLETASTHSSLAALAAYSDSE